MTQYYREMIILKRQKYSVKLSDEERKRLQEFIGSKSKKNTEQCKVHAKVILCLDENTESPMSAAQAGKKCKLHRENVYRIRKQFVEEGMDRILKRKKRETPPIEPKITGDVEAQIIAIACSAAPKGRKAWTLQMIADKIVLDGTLESISNVSIMRTLKKHNISLT